MLARPSGSTTLRTVQCLADPSPCQPPVWAGRHPPHCLTPAVVATTLHL